MVAAVAVLLLQRLLRPGLSAVQLLALLVSMPTQQLQQPQRRPATLHVRPSTSAPQGPALPLGFLLLLERSLHRHNWGTGPEWLWQNPLGAAAACICAMHRLGCMPSEQRVCPSWHPMHRWPAQHMQARPEALHGLPTCQRACGPISLELRPASLSSEISRSLRCCCCCTALKDAHAESPASPVCQGTMERPFVTRQRVPLHKRTRR